MPIGRAARQNRSAKPKPMHVSTQYPVETCRRADCDVKMCDEVIEGSLKKWAYNLSGFNKYGLHYDDCLYETEDVQEALRRIPQHVIDERNFRMVRAAQLSLTHTILPKEQWTKWEEDNKYLSPTVEQCRKERLEREEWEKNY